MRVKLSRLAVAVGAVVGLSLVTSTGINVSASEPTGPTETEQIAWQRDIDPYKDQVLQEAISHSNYSGATLDAVAQTLTVFGTGSPSTEVLELIDSAPPEISVSWQVVAYSSLDLGAAADEIMSRDTSVSSVSYAWDYSAIVVRTDLERASARHLRLLTNDTDVPIVLRDDSNSQATPLAGRANGSSPFAGGSRIERPNGFGCSTGARVKLPSDNLIMLTAWHCNNDNPDEYSGGVAGVPWNLSGDGTRVGMSTVWSSREWDVQGIDGQNYSKATWVGGAVNSQTLQYFETGSGPLATNEYVCLSGAFSGSTCGTQVRDLNYRWRFCDENRPFCFEHNSGVVLGDSSESGDPIAGTGDSGGPAFQYADGSGLKFGGLISAGKGSEATTCNGIVEGRSCFSRIVIAPWFRFKDDLGLTLP